MATPAPNTPEQSFITAETKQNREFTQCLSKLAATDAKHDFGLAYAVGDKIRVGLPAGSWPVTDFWDESSSLTSVLIQPPADSAAKSPAKIITLQKMMPSYNDHKTPYTIKIKNPTSDQPLHIYNGIVQPIKTATGFGDSVAFVTNCQLDQSVLVVDFNQNGFLEMLTKNGPGNETMYYVMIPELLNDPAGKTPLDDTIFNNFLKRNTGIKLLPMLETTNKTAVYNAYNTSINAPSNNFVSTNTLQLSPIINATQISGKKQSLYVTLNICSTADTGKIKQAEVKNCKKENSIKALLKFLTALLRGNTADNAFNYSAKLQQKRSGDWLQVLACLDIYNRTFVGTGDDTTVKIFTKTTNKVYFVTHDQIACAYALTMGVNVIFINQKNAYVLTNQLAESTTTPLERLKTSYDGIINDATRFRELNTFLAEYKITRDAYLAHYNTHITDSITELSTTMTENPLKCNNVGNANGYSLCINKIFRNCVMYCHIIMLLPDSTTITAKLNATYPATDTADNQFKFLQDFDYAYNVAQSIFAQHQRIGGASSSWIKSLEKSDAYQSATLWAWNYKKSGRVRAFFKAITLAPARDNDMYLFLSFIGNIKDNIAYAIMDAFDKYEKVITLTKQEPNADWPSDLFVSNNAELIKQIRVFLKREKIAQFESDKKYFMDERADASLYVENDIIIKAPPGPIVADFGRPSYWGMGRCSEEAIVQENTTSVVEDNTNPIISDYKNNYNTSFSNISPNAFAKGSDDNDDTTVTIVLDPAEHEGPIPAEHEALGGGYKGGFPPTGKRFDMITDVSIQETSAPLETAWLIYAFMTENGKSLAEYVSELVEDPTDANVPPNDRLITNYTRLPNEDPSEILTGDPRGDLVEEPSAGGALIKVGGAFDKDDVKINDTSIAYHPLLPIYMIACSYNANVTPDLEGSLDYDIYINYLSFLETMTNQLASTKYLSAVGQDKSKKIAKSYLIGLALRELLFTFNRDDNGMQTICGMGDNSVLHQISRSEYQSFSLMSSMFSDLVSGKIHEDEEEKEFGMLVLQSNVFTHFINNVVNIKSFLVQEVPLEIAQQNTIDVLNRRSLDLIDKISGIIIKDRTSSSRKATQAISNVQLSTFTTSTPNSNSPNSTPRPPSLSTLSQRSSIGVGGPGLGGRVLKTKKQKRKNNRNLKTKRQKNKRSNKKCTKKHRRRKQRKQTRKH